ncbi:hypothetical protein [Mesonia aquimarina]|uniref:hypothetical protein n=1 Tax=Mesonia aquimarina TaxID=1504967 RepID=UPI000EF6070E|nr:hypothetical protein [Mesonia aquimarina]
MLLANPFAIGSLALTALSTGEKAKSFIKDNGKTIVVGGAALVGGYFIYKHLTDKPTSITIREDQSKTPSSLSSFDAKQAADTLYEAMRYPGTDTQDIYEVLDGKTYNDFVKISNAFGKKYYQKQLGADGGSWIDNAYGLYEWLRFELDNDEIKHLQQIAPQVITTAMPINVGSKVASNVQGLAVYEAEEVNNLWQKGAFSQNYNKGDKIGTVEKLIPDGNGGEIAIIDKGVFSWTEVMANVNDLIVA